MSRQSVIRTNNTSLIRTDVDEDIGTEDVQEEQLPGNFSQKEDDAKVLPEVGQIKAEEIEVSGHEQLMSNVYNPQLEQFNEKISTPEIASTDVTKEAERLFKCKLCDSDFLDKKGLTQHHLSVHEKSKCQHCKQEFGKTNLQRHEKSCVKRIHSKKKKCPLCHKLVANSNTHLKTCKAKTIKERKRVTGSVDSDPQSLSLSHQNVVDHMMQYIAVSEDDAEVERLEQLEIMIKAMEGTAVMFTSRMNISLMRGVRSIARGQCLFETGSDQILHRVVWLFQDEDVDTNDHNPLMFQEIIDELGLESCSAQSIREGTVDFLSNNESAFGYFDFEGRDGIIYSAEERRTEYNRQLQELRKEGQYAMEAGDLLVDGMSAYLGLYIMVIRTSTPHHPVQLHYPSTFGGILKHDMPLLLLYDGNHSHFEEGRTSDMMSDLNLLFATEIFLEKNHWPYKYTQEGTEEAGDKECGDKQVEDDVAPTPKTKKRLYSLETPAVPQVFSPEEEASVSLKRPASKSTCRPPDKGKRTDRSPSPSGGDRQCDTAEPSITQAAEVSASPHCPAQNIQVVGSSRKMKKYEEELQNILSPDQQITLSNFRSRLNLIVENLPLLRDELKKARLGDDAMVNLLTMYAKSKKGHQYETTFTTKIVGKKEDKTLKAWLTQLKSKIMPFLHQKYKGIDLNILIDFKEEIEHPNYHRSDQPKTKKLFMLTESDITESINSSYNNLLHPGPSKHQLTMAWQNFCRAIALYAKQNKGWFLNRQDAQETISNYEDAANMVAGGITYFKGLAAHKKANDELKGKTQPELTDLARGVQLWYNSKEREHYKKTLVELDKKKTAPSHSQYVQCEEFVHTEMILSSPFRNVVWKDFQYRTLAEASTNPGWDPSDVSGRADETIETVTQDGFTFQLTSDISRPPPSKACVHQSTNPMCKCPASCPPCGYNVLLTWDKGNTQTTKNRYLHLPKELWELIMLFTNIRDRYFSCVLKNGPSGKEPSDWYMGCCPLLLNSAGKPNNAFTMSMASRVIGMDVTPHMFRKLFCTFLAHNGEESVRAAQPQVCGQSTSVFQQYYNLNRRRDAQNLIQILRSWRNNDEVESDTNNDWDRENQQRLMHELDRIESVEEEIDQVEETFDTHSFKNPITRTNFVALFNIATRMDKDIIASHPNFGSRRQDFIGVGRLTQEPWKKRLAKLSMQNSTNGDRLLQILLEIFQGREDVNRHKWSVVETMIERQQSSQERGKNEPQLWDPLWVLLETIFSSLTAKLKNVPTSTEQQEDQGCTCLSLPKNFTCIHCKKPVCDFCTR